MVASALASRSFLFLVLIGQHQGVLIPKSQVREPAGSAYIRHQPLVQSPGSRGGVGGPSHRIAVPLPVVHPERDKEKSSLLCLFLLEAVIIFLSYLEEHRAAMYNRTLYK